MVRTLPILRNLDKQTKGSPEGDSPHTLLFRHLSGKKGKKKEFLDGALVLAMYTQKLNATTPGKEHQSTLEWPGLVSVWLTKTNPSS